MLLILLFLVVAILVAEHNYRHWTTITGEVLPHPKRLVLNYVSGTLAYGIPFSIWLMESGFLIEAMVFWVFVLVAGITVILLYRHDAIVQKKQKQADELEIVKERLHHAEAKQGRNTDAPRA